MRMLKAALNWSIYRREFCLIAFLLLTAVFADLIGNSNRIGFGGDLLMKSYLEDEIDVLTF